MQIAQPLLLLLAFNLTYATFASEPTLAHRRKAIAREVFEKIAAKEAARCNEEGQGSREICSRPGIQMAMAKEKTRTHEFAAKVDPKARMLTTISHREASAERAAGRAAVGSSVVVLRNRNEISGTRSTGHTHSQQLSQPRRSKL